MRKIAGVDTGKEACQATVLSQDGAVVGRVEFPNATRGFQQLEGCLNKAAGDEIVVEASTYAYALIDHFRDHGFPVVVAHPKKVRMIAENENKTDWDDGHILADLRRSNYLPEAYVPDKPTLRLRELGRARWDVGDGFTQAKNRVHSILDRNAIKSPYEGTALWTQDGLAWLKSNPTGQEIHDALLRVRGLELEALEERKKILQSSLAQAASLVKDPALDALLATRGIDYYTAIVILAEVGDIHRFAQEKNFRAYAGCCKRNRVTAGHDYGKGSRHSFNRYLKGAFGRITEHVILQENPIQAYYRKQLKRTRSKIKAKARARRKVCDQVYRMLKSGTPCSWSRPGAAIVKRKRMQAAARGSAESTE